MENFKKDFFDTYKSNDQDNFNKTLASRNSLYEYIESEYLGIDKSSQIVELGCGYGTFLYFLENKGYKNTTGYDISTGQIEVGKGLTSVDLKACDIFNGIQNHEDNSVDFFVMIDVLEHIPVGQVMKLFKLIHSKLKVGGKLITHQPNALSPIVGSVLMNDITHEFAYTPELMTHLSKDVGFSSNFYQECGPYVHGIKSLIRKILWKTLRAFINLLYIAETGRARLVLTRNFYAILVK